MKKKPNKAPEPPEGLSRLLQSQESRQSLRWLIFDVWQKFLRSFFPS